ncbi:MAG: hypothetical protein M0Q47_00500 [Methanothrix sp.]|uniref:hypothetical protein n=1 Tax=Methanothrix sp. TaxID=90426 RepID=UPI0025F4FD86|nr:hypothetical protein [Methanothrix sp.]MCK9404882.1 hypothetical protein [Methanothrix sp.]
MSEDLPDSVVMLPAGAILYLVSELERLKVQVESHDRRITGIAAQLDEDCDRLGRDIAYDRQRLARLEASSDPTPSQKDRGEILRALLAANGGKMPEKEARQKMHLSKSQFSQLLAAMQGDIAAKPYHLDKRQKILQIK